MDIIQDYALHAYNAYQSADPYLRPIRTTLNQLQSKTLPLITPYLNRLALLAQDSPAILTVGVLLLFILIAMQILNFVRRIMMFWVWVIWKLVFWGAIALVVSVIVQRGLGNTVGDLVGWGQELNEVWWREYRRWEGYQNMNRAQNEGSGYDYSRTNAGARWR